ncbi:FG-GAP-like repeat-containing protein [Streptomyces sp. NPDC059009]|uniref:FG-GAP-like repeat-containing protein n=1 Tax=Streptomyces sp. NPDC059009 TaxID=3346694 RepID=UPI00368DA1CB
MRTPVRQRNKLLAAGALCAATVLGLSGLTAGGASAATPSKLTSDFNGDGYTDLAVGMPSATVGGKAKAGYVNVVWGGEKGLGRHGSVNVSQGTSGVPGTVEAGDLFGTAVTAADFNGDGYSDLAVSAPEEAIGDTPSMGTVSVVWGSANGFTKGGITALKSGTEDTRIGRIMTAGDYDGDGTQDLVFSSQGDEGTTTMTRPGPVTASSATTPSLVEGYAFGAPRTYASGDLDGDGTDELVTTHKGMEVAGTRALSKASGEWKNTWRAPDYGDSLAIGDYNHDGTKDLAIGLVRPNPEADPGNTYCKDTLGGAVALVLGAKGTTLGGAAGCTTQDSPGVGGTAEAEDNFGTSLATIHDPTGDQYDALLVGNSHEAVGTAKNAGAYSYLEASYDQPTFVGGMTTQNSDGVEGTAEAGDQFGATVAATGFYAGRYTDYAVGAPGENADSGGVWAAWGPDDAPFEDTHSVTPAKLGLSGAVSYGSVLPR